MLYSALARAVSGSILLICGEASRAMTITGALPEPLKRPLRNVRNILRHIPHLSSARYCPVCGRSSSRFGRAGAPLRDDVKSCGALERHRFRLRYFERSTDLFDGCAKRVLHVAPESTFERIARTAT